ncbi:hypothetical protein COCNU_scaffold005938G000010 [Cocos nucifera]|nr:hypothetical protein [Cocos nucifera]
MGSNLAGEQNQERERGRSRDGKVEREGFDLAIIVGYDDIEMPSSFHPYLSMGYMQFSIRGAIGAYSIHLSIDCSRTFTIGIYSIDS